MSPKQKAGAVTPLTDAEAQATEIYAILMQQASLKGIKVSAGKELWPSLPGLPESAERRLQKKVAAGQLKPALAALAWPRRWRLFCAHGHCPAPCPLLHRLGPCSRMCLARLGLCALCAAWAVSVELTLNAQRASSLHR